MYAEHLPRYLTSVLVEETAGAVVVTWKLGDLVPAPTVLHFGYEVAYSDIDGRGGRRFGVRFPSPTAYLWDDASDSHADYEGEHVSASDESVVVRFPDADIGVREVGPVRASSHINGVGGQYEFPAALLR